jgi:5-methylcytosine-specific restriction endonuclease McrA
LDTVNNPVLVLNQSYEPINICRARRAVVLIWQGKAEPLENDSSEIHSIECSFPLPSVIRLIYMVKKRPRFQRRLTHFEVFNRDKYTCQYCGKETKELTLDHILPRHRGGEHVWENVVSCCVACNRRKAGRTPEEAGMRLTRRPSPPRPTGFYIPYHYLYIHSGWRKFLAIEDH